MPATRPASFQLGLRHIAGFVVISGAIFAIGIQSGKSERSDPAGAFRPVVEPAVPVTSTDATFAERVPSYPGSVEISIDGEFRDAFGFPTKVKTLNAEDPADKVLAFYERHFTNKQYHVYPVSRPVTALAALDVQKKHGYMVMLLPQGKLRTRVFVTFTDYKRGGQGHTPRLVPLKLGNAAPIVVSGTGKSNEMAVYMLDEPPQQVFRNCGSQLEQAGWQQLQMPESAVKRGGVAAAHRVYVREGMELALTAHSEGGGKTVLMCMIYPRMG